MTSFMYRGRIMLAIVLVTILYVSGGCKKIAAAAGSQSALESLFEENFLNRDFIVNFASDSGINITTRYTGYNFVLTKTTSFYEGAITATRSGGPTHTGTWSSNDDYSKLDISITGAAVPPEFIFINRPWRFVKKAFPVMELSPWGTTDPKLLHMKRL